jgi:hypothetical protein
VRVRLLTITGVDLNAFEFDYDLTWAAFFMNASGKVYGRFGGRDGKGADSRNSPVGLHYAMEKALAEHRKNPDAKPDGPERKPVFVENLPTSKTYRGCIHCHQVKEIVREEEKKAGTWTRDSIYTYPLPENVGITLEKDRGDLVRAVANGSPASKLGIKTGDVLQRVNGNPIASFADVAHALQKAPAAGKIPIAWTRNGESMNGDMTVTAGWRKTNVTWRPSLLDLLPSLTVYGEDLTAKEKKSLGLDEKRLAFRQDDTVHTAAKAMGVQKGDIIIGVDNKILEMSMEQFLGHVRQNYIIGESLTLNVIRAGKRIDLKATLK